MSSRREITPEAGLKTAVALADFAVEVMRQRLREEFQAESDDEIQARLNRWLLYRPGAEWGDGEGFPGSWPRTKRAGR